MMFPISGPDFAESIITLSVTLYALAVSAFAYLLLDRKEMNPKYLNVRMNPETGDLWLTEERFRKPIRKITNITGHVMLCLCAEANKEGGDRGLSKEVRFSDGSVMRITIENIEDVSRNSA